MIAPASKKRGETVAQVIDENVSQFVLRDASETMNRTACFTTAPNSMTQTVVHEFEQ